MELSRKQTAVLFAALAALFAVRQAWNLGADLRTADEAHTCSAAARLAVNGGPLYANVLATKGPVAYWLAAGVYRVAGVYNQVALRLVWVGWWILTAAACYATARTLFGRLAALAAAAAFLLAATSPGFQQVRSDTLVPLPIVAAIGLCVRGSAKGKAGWLVGAGAAAAVAFLTKQQSGPVLLVVAGGPLAAWAWSRADRSALRAVCGAALVVAGFAATVGAAWAFYAWRGAGREFYHCVWSFNWAFLRHRAPTGGFLPSPAFLWKNVLRYWLSEPLLPTAVVGAVAGLAWRGRPRRNAAVSAAGAGASRPRVRGQDAHAPASGTLALRRTDTAVASDPVAWRARATLLAALLVVMWVAASPGDFEGPNWSEYIPYVIMLYVPMCLLVGLCTEMAAHAESGAGLLAAVLVAGVACHLAVPLVGPGAIPLALLEWDLTRFAWWHWPAALLAFAVAGWLLGGWRAGLVAALVWAVLYVAVPRSLGWRGDAPAAALGVAALGLVWHARRRRWPLLALAGGLVQAGACRLIYSAQIGLAVGAAAWLLLQRDVERSTRRLMAFAYAAPVLIMSVPFGWAAVADHLSRSGPWMAVSGWGLAVGWWLVASPLSLALAVCALVLAASPGRTFGEAWTRLRRQPLGLLLLAGLGAVAGGVGFHTTGRFVATPGAAVAMAGSLAVAGLLRGGPGVAGRRAPALLAGACVAALAGALGLGLRAPKALEPTSDSRALAEAMPPGSSAYIWGDVFQTQLYVQARVVPAAPQVYTWMLPSDLVPAAADAPWGQPHAATLEGLDEHLSAHPPPFVVAIERQRPRLEDFPRFGPLLRARYRVVKDVPLGRLYRLRGR